MQGEAARDRRLVTVEGADALPFLQGLVSNDVLPLGKGRVLREGSNIADVRLQPSDLQVQRGLGPAPEGAMPDPRHPALGWRRYGTEAGTAPQIDWDAIRVAHVIPETGRELIVDDSYILESGFERLHGVDFRKGCYVGQEVTARMKHKTELRKGLARVRVTGPAEYGAEITSGGKPAGTLFTRAGDLAIAYLRLDRATGPMQAGAAVVELDQPSD